STKQSIFATSSAEAEYIAAFDASKEAVWVRKFISWLGVVPTIKEPIKAEYIAAIDASKKAFGLESSFWSSCCSHN
nr:retrovirus-related Pol polyprotein from transposon TNT 1-94 [Tanacetum cinerariifolium]